MGSRGGQGLCEWRPFMRLEKSRQQSARITMLSVRKSQHGDVLGEMLVTSILNFILFLILKHLHQ